MNVLITGAGLIGAHTARQIAESGNRVALYDLAPNRDYIEKIAGRERVEVVAADARDLPALISALERLEIDTVVHTAGLIGSRVQENSYTGATNNILGTIHVLEAARLRKLRRVVYVSTFGAYDRSKITDNAVRETHPIAGHNLYAATKVCSEQLVHAYAGMYRLDTVIVRPAGVFGRGHYVGGSTVGRVMRDLALSIIKSAPFTIDPKIYPANEYVYGKDVARALWLACQAQNPKQRIYNAGTGVVTAPEELVQMARELAPTVDIQITAGGETPKPKPLPLDIGVSAAELGYTPKFSLKQALRDYMDELWSEGAP